jgi:hypothetical protein
VERNEKWLAHIWIQRRPASVTIAEISHVYELLSEQAVASSFPSVEKDTEFTISACQNGELMGWPFSRFHNCTVELK